MTPFLRTCLRASALGLLVGNLISCSALGGSGYPVLSIETQGDVVARTDLDKYFVGGLGEARVFIITKATGIPIQLTYVPGGRAWVKSDDDEETFDIVDDLSLGTKAVVIPGWIYGELFPNATLLPDGRFGTVFTGFTVVLSPGMP